MVKGTKCKFWWLLPDFFYSTHWDTSAANTTRSTQLIMGLKSSSYAVADLSLPCEFYVNVLFSKKKSEMSLKCTGCNRLGGTVCWARAPDDGFDFMGVKNDTCNMSCSALMGWCKAKVHTRCYHFFATIATFTAKVPTSDAEQAELGGRRILVTQREYNEILFLQYFCFFS